MPDARASQRQALLSQLDYLRDEVAALRQVVVRVPEALQRGRAFEDALSFQETLALLAGLDTHVRLPRLMRMQSETAPHFDAAESASLIREAHTASTSELLDALDTARRQLVDYATNLSPAQWDRTAHFPEGARDVYAYLYAITQEDAEVLRTLTYHLFDAQGLGG